MTQTNKDHLAELKVKRDALAYRIWAYCEPLGWDCTVRNVADALGVHWNAVRRISAINGWGNRFRSTSFSIEWQCRRAKWASLSADTTTMREVAELRGLRFAGDDE